MSHAPSSPRRLGRWLGTMLGRPVEPDTAPAVPPPLFARAPEPVSPEPVLPQPVLPEPVLADPVLPDTDMPDVGAMATLTSADRETDGAMFSPEVGLRIEAAKIVASTWDAVAMGSTADGTPAPKSRRQLHIAIDDMMRYLETGEITARPAAGKEPPDHAAAPWSSGDNPSRPTAPDIAES